jgi:putative flippase GtrA
VIAARVAAFAIVGALGFVVQLIVFAALTRAGWAYPAATAAAVEAAALHNFVWYEWRTWADRARPGTTARRLVRYNASVGGASIVGNVALVTALVRAFGVPPLAANVIAVAMLGVVNFAIADRWIFARA